MTLQRTLTLAAAALALGGWLLAGCLEYENALPGGLEPDGRDGEEEVTGDDGDHDPGDCCGVDDGGWRPCAGHEDCRPEQRCLDGLCVDDPPPCGDAPPAPDCDSDLERQPCVRQGGEWQCSGLDPGWCACVCPSGDAGCACWAPWHCQGYCAAEDNSAGCPELQIGRCGPDLVFAPMGCNCIAFEGTTFSSLCVD
ncbi:MAG TPA: hypothetical protein PK668_23055 [Myxococcota bacterium]|nr:hypothetical protein [Myxococcota bacterium]HRY95575.1 hypothetical protein [Myxococcota bacterium]HSA22865.1 hypothetical protein [Myxococcota bacterium]